MDRNLYTSAMKRGEKCGLLVKTSKVKKVGKNSKKVVDKWIIL